MPVETATTEAITTAWRAESARLVGALTRMTRDVELAEDLAQDALVAALEQWPATGVPTNPAAWLMTTAKRRGVDHFRRAENLRRKTEELGHARGEEEQVPDLDAQVDHIEDDVLRLIFLSCHPSLTPESRAALTLRLVGGLTTGEIARGFLVAETTMGQRISRAKKTLAEARAEFDLPTEAERVERLDDVMAVIYLIFNEGYAAAAGEHWMRPALADEGIRLARMLVALAPTEPETLGLQSLLEVQGSRAAARVDEEGVPVLLEAQDRTRWDQELIRRGLAALAGARALAARGKPVGKYFLQASIAAQHARARRAADTDWRQIARLYDVLATAAPGPVVEVNRAVAHGRAFGPDAGLAVLRAVEDTQLGDSPLVPSVSGDLLELAGRHSEAAAAFSDAAARSRNEAERTVLQRRAEENLARMSESG
ncbi:RNA polymerase sigma factor [Pedococcus bigeumensis]|uniref:Sigma-70 family RNA polymerase sigma factor n=1 Tax=Pedococcus bigeumensis TaxID=433644 RepID=A0A502CXF2_9MICO|nr:sigma-70 family RNA polymerase sigma factor [Pedococcus bigeumensis]TPG17210.1 sigma-70 family RNA polymerase sigma factor [Pedococcus bigeumensis]